MDPPWYVETSMPLTVGPGSIAIAITLGSVRPRVALPELALLGGAVGAGLIAIVRDGNFAGVVSETEE